jgi:hypothetical protein
MDQQRDVDLFVVEILAVEAGAVFSETLAVI